MRSPGENKPVARAYGGESRSDWGFLSYRRDVIEFTVYKKEARRGYGGLPVEEIMF